VTDAAGLTEGHPGAHESGGFVSSENALKPIDPQLEESWKRELAGEFEREYFRDLKTFLTSEKRGGVPVYPPGPLIFNAFNQTPFAAVKVVILGQDPYHGAGQAHGLSFSVQRGVRTPPSLQNMYKELHEDVGFEIPAHGNLEGWADQGVFLLNTSLTVRAGSPGSHAGRGWEEFTTAAVRALSERRKGIVFMLWGRHALAKRPLIDEARHLVLSAPHPSPFSAYTGFFGCRHFSKANEYLKGRGQTPIDWQLPRD
jgi:uracil-DNA glycosylase